MGIPCNQHLIAEVAKKPILQWRDPKLDYSGGHVPEEQRKLLEGKTVIAAPLADFIRMVREAVLPKARQMRNRPKPNGKKMVFVHASQDDFERARCVAQTPCRKNGYGIALPRYQGEPDKFARALSVVISVVMFCCCSTRKRQRMWWRIICRRHWFKPCKRETKPSMLICQGDDAEELYFIPPGDANVGVPQRF